MPITTRRVITTGPRPVMIRRGSGGSAIVRFGSARIGATAAPTVTATAIITVIVARTAVTGTIAGVITTVAVGNR